MRANHWSQLVERIPTAMAVFDRDMRYLAVSRRWLDDYGLRDRDVLGRGHYEVFPEIPERWREVHRRGLAGETVNDEQDRFVRSDGSVQWLRWTVRPWYEDEDRVAGLVIFSEDMTRLVETQHALDLHNRRLRRLAEVVEQVATVRDLAALMDVIRPAVRELCGADGVTLVLNDDGQCHYVDEDAIGPLWKGQRFPLESCISGWAMIHAEPAVIEDIYADPRIPHEAYRPTFVKSLAMVPVGRTPPKAAIGCYWASRHRATAEELELQQALADAMSVGLANIALYQSLEQRVAERDAAVRQLRESEQRLEVARTAARLGIYVYDPPTGAIHWDERARELWGVGADETITFDLFLAAIHPDDRAATLHAIERASDLAGSGHFHASYRVRNRRDGIERWIEATGLVAFKDARAVRLIGTVADISERKNIEADLVRAKEDAEAAAHAKSAFLANMSHEMRTPLHVVIGLAHLMARDERDATQQVRLRQLTESSEHLLAIINDILDLSKADAGRLDIDVAPFHLDDVVAKVLCMLGPEAQNKGLEFSGALASPLSGAAVLGDAQRLSQVLLNLCGNAIKFTARGSVRLRIECLRQETDGFAVRFAVDDTGIGIAPEDKARLFGAFEQGDASSTRVYGGSGLGLAISQRLVQMMGGSIAVDSRAGAGSSFFFDLALPRAADAAAPSPVARPDTADHFLGMRVLFAEDHPLSQEIVLQMLEDLGCEADIAANGFEAVECAQARPYDLILMDMQMPGMDGLAATRAIRALPDCGRVPIIALTANAFAEDRARCLEAGMNGHLAKPLTPAALAAALGQWLPAIPPIEEDPPCDTEASRALLAHGLDVPATWRASEEHLQDYLAHLDRFFDQQGRDLARLRIDLEAGNFAAAASLAHQMKGIAGLLGAKRLHTLAAQLNEALRGAAEPVAAGRLLTDCEGELSRLAAAVAAGLRSGSVAPN